MIITLILGGVLAGIAGGAGTWLFLKFESIVKKEIALLEVDVVEKVDEIKAVTVRDICSVCGRKVAKFVTNAEGKTICLLHKGI